MHLAAVVRGTEFVKHIEGERLNISQVLDVKSQAQILKNREVVKVIGQTVHFLAKQNIPLRAHHDNSQCLELEHVNTGNFQELLKFHCEAGDICLKQHFELGHKNATYRSKRIQNQIITYLESIKLRVI